MSDSYGRLLNHLPAIYHKSQTLHQLLALFENVLLGHGQKGMEKNEKRQTGDASVSLEEKIATIAGLFNPWETPGEFLPWLSQWVALSDFGLLSEAQRRQMIAQIVPLYALRGTKVYMERLLELFKPVSFQIMVDDRGTQGFCVGVSKVGLDTVFLPEQPFWFRVIVTLSDADKARPDLQAFREHWERRLRRIIDLAKPVHTLYRYEWKDST